MIVLFTKSNKIGSKLIRALTEEPVSHCAIYLPDLGTVIHSNFSGVKTQSFSSFLKDNTIVYHVDVPSPGLQIPESYASVSYDYLAFIYFGFMLIWKKMTGIPVSKTNHWAQKRAFLCTELVTFILWGAEDSTLTPYGLYLALQKDT